MLREQEANVANLRKEVAKALERLDVLISWSQRETNHGKFWTKGDIPGQPFSYSEALLEAQRVSAAVDAIPASRMGLASSAATSALLTAVKGLRQSVSQLDTALGTANKLADGFDVSATYIVTKKDGEQVADAGQLAAACVSSAEAVKAALPQFVVYPKSDPKIGKVELATNAALRQSIANAASAIEEALAEVEARRDAAARAEKSAIEAGSKAEEMRDATVASKDEAARLASESKTYLEELRNQAEEAKGQLDANVDEIHGLKEEAIKIKSEADAFQAEITGTRENLNQLIRRAAAKFSEQEAYVKHAEELVEKATSMLSQATVAGLAKAFDDERKELDRRMRGAMIGFSVGIGLIFLVTALLAAYVFRIEVGEGILGIPQETAVTVSGFLARSVILLGPVWLALFSARRYRNLFDLRQQYSHKYNMAFSVNGFQTQAPEYKEQIAYWVFQTIGANPVANGTQSAGMDEHPMDGIKNLLQSVVDRLPFPAKPEG